jgi:molecular chaperone GrpE (heat shock protein)
MLARLRPDAPFDRTEGIFFKDDPRIADLTAQLEEANSSIRRLEDIISRLERSLQEEREYEADEQLQALAQRLENSFKTIHTFQTEKSRNYSNKGIPDLLKKIETVDKNMTTLMRSLRKGKNSRDVTIEQMQKDVNEISTLQSIYAFGYHENDFANYMKSIRDVTGILYDYLHTQTL